MTFDEKLYIYDNLLTNYKVGEPILLSNIVNWLTSHGITPLSYGYPKALPMMSAMPEVVQISSVQPREGVPLVYSVTLLPRPLQEHSAPCAEEAGPCPATGEAATQGAEAGATQSGAQPAENGVPVLPACLDGDAVFFPYKTQCILNKYLTGNDTVPLTAEQMKQFCADYAGAFANEALNYDGKYKAYSFALTAKTTDGGNIFASVKLADHGLAPWVINSIRVERGAKPSEALRRFAFLGNITAFLTLLAEHAQEEPWGFSNSGTDKSILMQYISYTFYRVQQQGKVCIEAGGQFAAFNTGLQSRRLGEDLFAYFVPNDAGGDSPWRFYCFCSADSRDTDERRCYKLMVNEFKEPEIASYFSNISDLLFDPCCEVRLSSDHIFKDNANRLPLEFLKHECDINEEAAGLLASIETAPNRAARKELFAQLGTVITDDPDLFAALNERLEGALNRTLKRVRRNYKLAVPCFFPSRNVMSMMLPLSFTSTGAPSIVLVCERTQRGEYLGQTILTMSMAYLDSRLLCRPSSEWLNVEFIHDGDEDELTEI